MPHILSFNQTKMLKSEHYQHVSAALQLAPAFNYKGHCTCPWAGKCAHTCIAHCGLNSMEIPQEAQKRRTRLYYDDRKQFISLLVADIYSLLRKAERENAKPTLRLNCLSDVPFHKDIPEIFSDFKEIQFIDYTKEFARLFEDLPENYHLTYSLNEKSPKDATKRIFSGTPYNVAQVYTGERPEKIHGFPTIDGDLSDLRHLDPRGHVVALKYKNARHRVTGKHIKPKPSLFILG